MVDHYPKWNFPMVRDKAFEESIWCEMDKRGRGEHIGETERGKGAPKMYHYSQGFKKFTKQ